MCGRKKRQWMTKKTYSHTKEIMKRGRPIIVGEPEPYVAFSCDICGVETLVEPDTETVVAPKRWTVRDDGKHICGRCTDRKRVLF